MSKDNERGTKRERDDGNDRKGKGKAQGKQREGEGATGSLAGKLHHSHQVITRAAKKARTFEIQKLARKVKSDNPKDVEVQPEMQAILVALKELDLESLSSHALRSKLTKGKTGLLALEEVQTYCATLPETSIDPTSTAGKAQNRVLASKTLVEAMNEVLTVLRGRAGIKAGAAQKGKGKQEQKEVKSSSKPVVTPASRKKKDVRQTAGASGSETSSSEASDIDEGEDLSSDEDGTVSHISAEDEMPGPEDDFSGFDAHVAGSDDEASVASSSSFPLNAPSPPPKISSKSKEGKLDKSRKAGREETVERAPPTTSAFLPSLAGGYTLGDSDGSVYDFSGDEGTGKVKVERKNRRGQRARQAIWEKKYGKGAKHVVKRQKLEAETEENRRKTRAEKEIESLKKSGRYVYGVDSNLTNMAPGKQQRTWAAAQEGAPAIADPSTAVGGKDKAKKPTSDALHPSWVAKQKAKEMEASISTAKPAGKKIRF